MEIMNSKGMCHVWNSFRRSAAFIFTYSLTPRSSTGLPPFPYARGFYTYHRYRDAEGAAYNGYIYEVYEKKISA
jgi:hypothetical protein